MSWLAGHSWIWWLLSGLLGFGITWWWMVRKVRGRIPIERVIERTTGGEVAAGSTGTASAASATFAGAGVVGAAGMAAAAATRRDVDVAPVTEAVAAPVVEAPVVQTPVAEAPVVEEPVVEAVEAADVAAPVVDAPVVDEPVVEEPVVDEVEAAAPDAVVEEPVVDEPVVEEPVVDEPVVEDSVVDEPVIEEPVVDGHVDAAPASLAAGAGLAAAAAAASTGSHEVETGAVTDDVDAPAVAAEPEAVVAEPEAVVADEAVETPTSALLGTGAAAGAAGYAVGAYGAGSVDPLADGSMPEGYPIKGNADSMLYHSPESPWYGRTKAEAWFADEDTAQAAGFARWDSKARGGGEGDAGAAGAAAALAAPTYAVGAYGAGSVDPLEDGSMPEGYPIKGNADSMLYHSPESPWYGRTKAEAWFADESTAQAAGFARWDSKARGAGDGAATLAAPAYAPGKFGAGSVDPLEDGSMPTGYPVKGNEDSMLFHTPESPWYARTRAEVWFADEATAAAAGFRHWDPDKR